MPDGIACRLERATSESNGGFVGEVRLSGVKPDSRGRAHFDVGRALCPTGSHVAWNAQRLSPTAVSLAKS